MSSMFRRRERRVPGLNTSSLPDLIFTVLFFFMIVTHMREVELKVRYQVPAGTELEKLTRKSAVSYVYIGQPVSPTGERHQIQLNDKYATAADIEDFVAAERRSMSSEDARRMTVSIKADRQTPMAVVADVKRALQKSGALKINYSSVSAGQSAPIPSR